MKKVLVVLGAAIVIVLLGVFLRSPRVCIEKNCFKVDVASTPEERARGLMYQEALDSESGMIFVFDEEGNQTFWMKNTLIPLDIIWLDEDGKIVDIAHNVEPCILEPCKIYSPDEPAKFVLEIAGGSADRLGISEGQIARIELGYSFKP